jgi:hypothetical protein
MLLVMTVSAPSSMPVGRDRRPSENSIHLHHNTRISCSRGGRRNAEQPLYTRL